LLQLLLEENGVRAEVDVLAPRDQLGHEGADLRVHEGLAAGDADHRRPALLHRRQALRDAEMLPQYMSGVLDLAAAGTGEVAAEQRLEHEHEWIAGIPAQALLEDVAGDRPHLRQRNA